MRFWLESTNHMNRELIFRWNGHFAVRVSRISQINSEQNSKVYCVLIFKSFDTSHNKQFHYIHFHRNLFTENLKRSLKRFLRKFSLGTSNIFFSFSDADADALTLWEENQIFLAIETMIMPQ